MIVDTDNAAKALLRGDVVAIPTETVYGLAARYDNAESIQRIFTLKNRPLDHPLIVHIADVAWLDKLTFNYPAYVPKLIEAFWPGPLTLVLPKRDCVSDLITAGQATVAIRMPNHATCLQILNQLGVPVVAPSANPYCRISPTLANHVTKYFSERVAVVDGGACECGIESTIVLATDKQHLQILRPGLLSQQNIESVAGVPCVQANKSIKVSGNKYKHYAPRVALIPFHDANEIAAYVGDNQKRYLVISMQDIDVGQHDHRHIDSEPQQYAATLYALWHEAEQYDYDAILLQLPENTPKWQGVLDRIAKASV